LLEGKGVSSGANGALIELRGVGNVAIPTQAGFDPDAIVNVIIRPEHIRIAPLRQDRPGQLSGVVKTVSFCGAETQYRVGLGNGSSDLLVRRYNAPDEGGMVIAAGEMVSLDFIANTARVLPG